MPADMSEPCIDCGTVQRADQMDMTGKGWRCDPCTLAASVKKLEGGSTLVEHLDRNELERTARRASSEIKIAIGMAVLGVPVLIGGLSINLRKITGVGFAMVFGGIAGVFHGRSLKRDAERGMLELESR